MRLSGKGRHAFLSPRVLGQPPDVRGRLGERAKEAFSAPGAQPEEDFLREETGRFDTGAWAARFATEKRMIPRLSIAVAGLLAVLGSALAQERAQDDGAPSRPPLGFSQKQVEPLGDHVAARGRTGSGIRWNLGVQWRVMANGANFASHAVTIADGEDTRRFINQRFRTWLSVSPTEKVGRYLQLQVGNIGWGEEGEGPKTFEVEGESVGIALRRGFLRYVSDDIGVFRVGIQDWHDAFGESPTLGSFDAIDDYDSFRAVLANSIWDFDVGGVAWSRTFPDAAGLAVNAGVFQLWEGDEARADGAFLFALDGDVAAGNEGERIGASLYYLDDRGGYSYPTAVPYDSSWDVWFGVRASKKVRALPLRGWVILNAGRRDETAGSDFRHTGWAAKLEAFDIALGSGKLSAQALYSSGDDDPTDDHSGEFRTIAQSARDNFGAQGYWSYLMISSPHGPSDVKDLGVGLQNRGLGLLTVQVKYDFPVAGPLSASAAAGWLRSAEDNPGSGARDMGVEIGQAFHLDLGRGLALDFGGAYFFTGDFYRAAGGGSPDDLWETFLRAQLEL